VSLGAKSEIEYAALQQMNENWAWEEAAQSSSLLLRDAAQVALVQTGRT
jgi:hypothetical protein